MIELQWALDVGQAIPNAFIGCCSAASGLMKSSWAWLLLPQQRDRRIYSIIKWIVYILVGIVLTLYIGWKGIELAQAGLRISRQSNGLSAKQICNGDVSTVFTPLTCEETKQRYRT
jgi:hypothetical protein